jgi:ABC-type nitrate/sulfonate/bicarbonate transport system substrate-binding protein
MTTPRFIILLLGQLAILALMLVAIVCTPGCRFHAAVTTPTITVDIGWAPNGLHAAPTTQSAPTTQKAP